MRRSSILRATGVLALATVLAVPAAVTPAAADGRWEHHGGWGGGRAWHGGGWHDRDWHGGGCGGCAVGGALLGFGIGAAVGAAIAAPPPAYYAPPPVVYYGG